MMVPFPLGLRALAWSLADCSRELMTGLNTHYYEVLYTMKLKNTNKHSHTLHTHNIYTTNNHTLYCDQKQLTHRRIVSWRISRQQEQTTHQTRPQYQRKNCSRVGRPSLRYYQWQLHTSNHYFSKHLPSPRKL